MNVSINSSSMARLTIRDVVCLAACLILTELLLVQQVAGRTPDFTLSITPSTAETGVITVQTVYCHLQLDDLPLSAINAFLLADCNGNKLYEIQRQQGAVQHIFHKPDDQKWARISAIMEGPSNHLQLNWTCETRAPMCYKCSVSYTAVPNGTEHIATAQVNVSVEPKAAGALEGYVILSSNAVTVSIAVFGALGVILLLPFPIVACLKRFRSRPVFDGSNLPPPRSDGIKLTNVRKTTDCSTSSAQPHVQEQEDFVSNDPARAFVIDEIGKPSTGTPESFQTRVMSLGEYSNEGPSARLNIPSTERLSPNDVSQDRVISLKAVGSDEADPDNAAAVCVSDSRKMDRVDDPNRVECISITSPPCKKRRDRESV